MYQIIEKMQYPHQRQTIFLLFRKSFTRATFTLTAMCFMLQGIGIQTTSAATRQEIVRDAQRVSARFISQRTQQKKTSSSKKGRPAPKKTAAPEIIPERSAFSPSSQKIQPKGGDTQNPQSQTTIPRHHRASPRLTSADVEARAIAATVNIVCVVSHNGKESSSLGSGVVISPDGYILTNAHVGIYSLFAERTLKTPLGTVTEPNCVARMGSPATVAFELQPVYVPASWVAEYAHRLFSEKLTGTGAGDYMLLKRRGTGAPLPFITPDVTLGSILPKDIILGSGYPAEFLGSESVQSNLFLSSSYITVGEALTFASNTPDTFTLPGTILARAGISGGPVLDAWGSVVGIMSTSTREGTTAERTLRAISLEYIDRDLRASVSAPLSDFLSGSPIAAAASEKSRQYAQTILGALYPL